jgi:hypothetical protein
MRTQQPQSRRKIHWVLGACAIALLAGVSLSSCTAMDPQSAAQQYAPMYYNQPYSSLSPQQKMQLENHLASQSNQAWRTTAMLTSSIGRLAGGTGILLFAARH